MTGVAGGPSRRAYGRGFWLAAAAGGLVMAFGVRGLLGHAEATMPAAWARWLAAVLLGHDLLVAPALLAAGWLVGRLPGGWRAPVRAALVVSATVVLVTLPAFLGDGRATQPGNASLLPNHYSRSLMLVLLPVWAVAITPILWHARSRGGPGGGFRLPRRGDGRRGG
ncbi:MAG TPA: hypothetical protein VFU54_18555 [Actinomycetota bacterium]|nr:hypothetical protein [Actinomycetota bacterium]